MKGYFGIGVENITKPFNVGNLFRSAHAFEASFVFTVNTRYSKQTGRGTDTSDAVAQLPFYTFETPRDLMLPRLCRLVGVELMADAIDLPSFSHPPQAAYILGPERGALSEETVAACDFVVKIPTRFCVNLGIAGALVMYDRLLTHGRFANRPVRTGGPVEPPPEHHHGGPVLRRKVPETDAMRAARELPPLEAVDFARKEGES